MEYVLETNALSKRYRNFTALSGVTMHIPKGATPENHRASGLHGRRRYAGIVYFPACK